MIYPKVMAVKKTCKNLIAQVYSDIADTFQNQISERGIKQKAAFSAAIKLWTELPPEIQARLLDQSLNGSTFIGLVNQVIDARFSKKKSSSKG
jgi:hypothetical protein